MSILVTGGRGNTSSGLCALLHEAKVPFVVASRSKDESSPYQQAQFDWLDESTYEPLLQSTLFNAVYLIPPPTVDMVERTKAFIVVALSQGVRRFVLLSSSAVEAGGPAHGQIHEYLISQDVEFAVLRPSWFQQNIGKQPERLDIKDSLKIYSAAGDGKIPWVSTSDIAAVAFRALTDEKPHNTDHLILGPELLSYANVAALLSEATGRKFEHANLTEAQLMERLRQAGIPDGLAGFLAALDTMVANGGEEKLNDVIEKVIGRPPKRFSAYVEGNKDKFM